MLNVGNSLPGWYRLVIANESSWIDASNQLSLGSTDWGDVVCVWGWAGFVSEAISAETAFPSPSSGQPISFVPNNIHLLHLPHRRPFPLSKSGWNFWLGKRWLLSPINRLRFIELMVERGKLECKTQLLVQFSSFYFEISPSLYSHPYFWSLREA